MDRSQDLKKNDKADYTEDLEDGVQRGAPPSEKSGHFLPFSSYHIPLLPALFFVALVENGKAYFRF